MKSRERVYGEVRGSKLSCCLLLWWLLGRSLLEDIVNEKSFTKVFLPLKQSQCSKTELNTHPILLGLPAIHSFKLFNESVSHRQGCKVMSAPMYVNCSCHGLS